MAIPLVSAVNLLHSNAESLKKPNDVKLGLEKLRLLANLTQAAVDHFLNKRLSAFDALVGENACETRASYILDLVQNDSFYKSITARKIQLDKICGLLGNEEFFENAKKDPSLLRKNLSEISCQLGVHFELSDEEAFLVQAFILCQTKKDINGQDRSNPSKLSKYGAVSASVCKSLVKETQKDLSQKSVDYVQKLAQQSRNGQLEEFTSDAYLLKDDNERIAAPCYFSLKAIMQHIWEKKQSILYKIHVKGSSDLLILFKPGKKPGTFERVPVYKHLNDAVHVWEGTSDLPREKVIAAFDQLTPWGIFAMNNAQHPFYFGNSAKKRMQWEGSKFYKKAVKEVAGLTLFAKKIGCHAENRKVFFHDHSFCDTVQNQLENPSEKNEGKKDGD